MKTMTAISRWMGGVLGVLGVGRWVVAFGLGFLLVGGVGQGMTPEEVAEEIKQCTVRVVTLDKENKILGHGSGFFISNQGHVATNRHVIEAAKRVVVLFCQGDRVFFREADLVGKGETVDLAILKIDPISSAKVVKICTAELVAAQAVMSVGFPGAIDVIDSWATFEGVDINKRTVDGRITSPEAKADFIPAVFSGAVAKCEIEDGAKWVLHSAKVSGGKSGGPLIDADGRVCGINTQNIAAGKAGTDYPRSIHASELVNLARTHSIALGGVSASKVAPAGSLSRVQLGLFMALGLFSVVLFLMVLRKPREVMVNAMTKLVRPQRPVVPLVGRGGERGPVPAPVRGSSGSGTMRLRGRDLQGKAFSLGFGEEDFRRGGGRLVIGRNGDLSQLILAHDSISRQHATLLWTGGGVSVEDRNSGNGTKVNGRRVESGGAAVALRSGDQLTLGEVELGFEILR